ncbi:MAG TPA: hypothetical protein PKC80_10155 [Burkholderiaceae bacterium]|nr:hypothetical protein [Burkholderiaceae bacterium]
MNIVVSLLVGKPINILIVGIVFLVAYLISRFAAPAKQLQVKPLLISTIAWCSYAVWEWFVLVKSPEANIRIDLLVIWPMLAILSAWTLYRLLQSKSMKS